MIDDRTVERVFRILRAQVPGQHPELTGDTTEVWLGRLRRVAEPVLMEAATTWGAMNFPNLGEFAAHCDATARRLMAQDRERYEAGVLDVVGCPECGEGDGWVEEPATQREGYDVPVRPCSRCNPRGFWLWRGGHYGPEHTCTVCRALHKGDGAPLAEAMASALTGATEATATPGPRSDF